MESIIQEEKYTRCRYCGGLVYANNPVCSKCGLEMNSQGIKELAEIENENNNAVNLLNRVKFISYVFPVVTVASVVFGLVFKLNGLFFGLFFELFVLVIIFWGWWNLKYSKFVFSIEDEKTIKEYKNEILITFTFTVIIGLSFFVYLLGR